MTIYTKFKEIADNKTFRSEEDVYITIAEELNISVDFVKDIVNKNNETIKEFLMNPIYCFIKGIALPSSFHFYWKTNKQIKKRIPYLQTIIERQRNNNDYKPVVDQLQHILDYYKEEETRLNKNKEVQENGKKDN